MESAFGLPASASRPGLARFASLVLLAASVIDLAGAGDSPPTAPAPQGPVAASDKEAASSKEKIDPMAYFKRHFFGYDPFYFIAGTESPNAKFQISFRYQIFDADGAIVRNLPWTDRLNFGYTQTTLWDWNEASAPFYDTSYKPELMYRWENLLKGDSGWLGRVGLRLGIQHESNGKSGAESRSLNIVYVRPTLVFGDELDFHVTLGPRAWAYIGGVEDNQDIADYRGYVDLRASIGWANSVMLDGTFRLGDDWDHGSAQIDLTYPLYRLWGRGFSVYLQVQYFSGYGESLLGYNQRTSALRAGFALYR